jgi:arabinofuranosyltransferase
MGQRLWLGLILAVSWVILYLGWKTFWFLTDDAFIAFRHISNSMMGHGYVWNVPPFRAVEGYTSFLWVVVLEYVWKLFSIEPPQSANTISLLCSGVTLLIAAIAAWRMKLVKGLLRFRPVLVSLVMLGIVSNTTFLTWSSSGLETAMFNMWFTIWIVIAVLGASYNRRWLLALSGAASMVYLSRPDGMLVVLCTLGIVAAITFVRHRSNQKIGRWLLGCIPLVIVPLHFLWRRFTYGEWLPNTYYAKHVAAWPESGIRYLASFVMEYGLWLWVILMGWAIFAAWKHHRDSSQKSSLNRRLPLAVRGLAVAAIAGQVLYYTLIIGGDHFEYRVYSHLIPLIFLSSLWAINALNLQPLRAVAALAAIVLLSVPISWTHFALTKDLQTRTETHMLVARVTPFFPSWLRWYSQPFDTLQGWLIKHHVCMRRQEHYQFYRFQARRFPTRSEGKFIRPDGLPVMELTTVGIPGWALPHINVIDRYGLNDYVIARSAPFPRVERLMAHDRYPPNGYVESFDPNVRAVENQRIEIRQRQVTFTADRIRSIEREWAQRVKTSGEGD